MDFLVSIADGQAVTGHNVNLRCPVCQHEGSFHPFDKVVDVRFPARDAKNQGSYYDWFIAGMRQCPNAECNALVFVVKRNNDLVVSYPPQVLDFDATALPEAVLASLEEAIGCHSAGCYRAAALMVRRTLEDLCSDKHAEGANLKARIAALRSTIVISDELLTAADELRLLGNDAAHIEAKTYDAIEAEEVEVAIELTKELLKAVYQHTSLIERLRALKKANTA